MPARFVLGPPFAHAIRSGVIPKPAGALYAGRTARRPFLKKKKERFFVPFRPSKTLLFDGISAAQSTAQVAAFDGFYGSSYAMLVREPAERFAHAEYDGTTVSNTITSGAAPFDGFSAP